MARGNQAPQDRRYVANVPNAPMTAATALPVSMARHSGHKDRALVRRSFWQLGNHHGSAGGAYLVVRGCLHLSR